MIYELLEFYRYALGLYLSLFSLTCTGYVEFVFQKSIPVTQVSLRGTPCLCCVSVAVVPDPLYSVPFRFCKLQNPSEEVELTCIALSLGVLLGWKRSRSDKIAAKSSVDDLFVTISIIFVPFCDHHYHPSIPMFGGSRRSLSGQNRLMCSQSTLPWLGWIEMYNIA